MLNRTLRDATIPAGPAGPDTPGFRLVVDTAEGAEAAGKRLPVALEAAITKAAPDAGWDDGKPLAVDFDPAGRPLFSGSGRLHDQGRRPDTRRSRRTPCRTAATCSSSATNFTGLGVHQAEPVLDAGSVTTIATDLAGQIRE